MKGLVVLGSTGSIGRQTLDIVRSLPDRFKVLGLAAGIGISVALVSIYDLGIGVWHSVIVGGLIAIFSQAGDLALSLVKRAAGVKNASGLIPGHGGLLDRLDSLILAVLVLYYFLQYR